MAAKQATKKRPQKKTVEQNLSNINLSESEMKCEVNNVIEICDALNDIVYYIDEV